MNEEKGQLKAGHPLRPKAHEAPRSGVRDPYVRAANEDDDGYDSYSDRPAEDPFYEEDPWR